MSGQTQSGKETELTPKQRELLTKASKIILALDKTTKSLKFYLANNPILIKHKEDLLNSFNDYFDNESELTYRVTSSTFSFMDNTVYENKNKNENFAFKLYNDGIRSLTFNRGVSIEELTEFMTILNKGLDIQSTDADEDLVTLLWERQFENIRYQVVESIIDSAYVEDGKSTDEKLEEITNENKSEFFGLGEEYEDIIDMEEIPITFDATNFGEMFKAKGVLAKEEVETIKNEIHLADKRETVLKNFMDIIPHILKEEVTKEDIIKTLNILKRIVDSCIFTGDIATAGKIISKLKSFPEVLTKGSIPIESELKDFVKSFSTKEKVGELINALNLSFAGSGEELAKYISSMHEKIVPSLLQALPEITDTHYRKAFLSGLANIFKGDPNSLLKYFNTKDRARVEDLIYLLSKLDDERVLDLLPHLIKHSDRSVKKESLSLLKNFPKHPKISKILLNSLEDSDIEIRTLSLRIIAACESPEVSRSLISKITHPQFNEKELIEKKSYFFAMSKVAKDKFLPYISDIIEKKRWSGTKDQLEELYQCSCFALGIIGSDKAKEMLERGTGSKNKTIQKYCRSVLRKIDVGS